MVLMTFNAYGYGKDIERLRVPALRGWHLFRTRLEERRYIVGLTKDNGHGGSLPHERIG